MRIKKLIKVLVAMSLLFMSSTSIYATSNTYTDEEISEMYEVKERGITVELKKKNEDGLILRGDEVNFNATLAVNYKELLKNYFGVTNPDANNIVIDYAHFELAGDSYLYSEKRDNKVEYYENISASSVVFDLENSSVLKYAGNGSKVHITGYFDISYTGSSAEELRINVDAVYDAEELGGGETYTKLDKNLLIARYQLSVDKVTKNTPFNLDIDIVDPNLEYNSINNKKFTSSYVLLTSTAFNSSNKIGTISNLHKNEQGYLAYTVSFENLYWVEEGDVTFNINYQGRVFEGGQGKQFNQTKDVSLKIFEVSDKEETSTNLKPKLIITDYAGINSITAGNSAKISVTFTNTSADTAIENVVFTVNGGTAFTIASGVNKFYVEKIEPKGTYTLNVNINCLKTTPVGSHDVTFDATYAYSGSTIEESAESVLTIPVSQVDRVRINYVKMSNVYQDSESEVNYSILNNGLADVYNANIEILDADGNVLESLYLGNIKATNEAKGTNIYLSFAEEGDKTLTLRLTYEDENFNKKEITEDFDIYVQGNSWYYEPDYYDEPIIEEPVDVQPDNTMKYIGIGAVVVVLLGGIVVYRKKKRNKGIINDEDL